MIIQQDLRLSCSNYRNVWHCYLMVEVLWGIGHKDPSLIGIEQAVVIVIGGKHYAYCACVIYEQVTHS